MFKNRSMQVKFVKDNPETQITEERKSFFTTENVALASVAIRNVAKDLALVALCAYAAKSTIDSTSTIVVHHATK